MGGETIATNPNLAHVTGVDDRSHFALLQAYVPVTRNRLTMGCKGLENRHDERGWSVRANDWSSHSPPSSERTLRSRMDVAHDAA
jgi:hypothetical protein